MRSTLACAFGFFVAGLAGSLLGGPWETVGGVIWLCGALLFLAPTRIRVGPEGIAIRWLWVKRHLALADIVEIAVYDETPWIRFREIGPRIVLPDRRVHLPMRYHDRLAFWSREPAKDTELLVACVEPATAVGTTLPPGAYDESP